jgi:nitrite reductase/ring-hydroxylating ferredoxin subunit
VTFDMTWFDVADVADLEGLDVIGVETAGRKLAIFRLGSDYYATSNVCAHLAGVLSDGEAVEGYVECPLHDGLFDIRTGKAQGGPVGKDPRTYPVRVEGTRLLVRIDGASDETARAP